MELHQLRYFVAVAESGGFCRAAEQCRTAQPSLSQQVRKLELELGVRLFDRLGRKTVLTEHGELLLPRARKVLAEVQGMRVKDGEMNGGCRMTIGAIPTIAPLLVAPVLPALRRKLPGCEIEIREDLTERLLAAVAEAKLDAAFVAAPIEHELIVTESLGVESLLLAVHSAHPFAKKADVALGDLESEPFILLQEVHCFGRQVGELCRSRHVKPSTVCTSSQISTAIAMVEGGLGMTIVPASAAGPRKQVKFVALRGAGMKREICVAWRRDRTRSRAARVLAELVGERLGG